MPDTLQQRFHGRLPDLDPGDPGYASQVVDTFLDEARTAGASDIHLLPEEDGLRMLWRVDGVLQPVALFPREVSANIVSRLKVLAELLTYQTGVPQEGRIRTGDEHVETRVSTFPTLYGEKAVVRLFVGSGRYRYLDDLGLPGSIEQALKEMLHETGGVILLSGPAGSGKTTTAYASLRELIRASASSRSLVTLEDPIEAVVPGAAQSQINPSAGFDYETGLRSLMRQDPEVILVGEIRDRNTAEIVFQASLTGHLVLTTFHAGSAAETVSRLHDLGIEPYLLRSGLLAILSQRLVRRLCGCAEVGTNPEDRLGLNVTEARVPVGCKECNGTGYRGRLVLAEMLHPRRAEMKPLLARHDAREIERLSVEAGLVTQWQAAEEVVRQGRTSAAEVRRVFGTSAQ